MESNYRMIVNCGLYGDDDLTFHPLFFCSYLCDCKVAPSKTVDGGCSCKPVCAKVFYFLFVFVNMYRLIRFFFLLKCFGINILLPHAVWDQCLGSLWSGWLKTKPLFSLDSWFNLWGNGWHVRVRLAVTTQLCKFLSAFFTGLFFPPKITILLVSVHMADI